MKKRWFLWVGAGIILLGLVILVINAFTSLFNPWIAGGGFLISIIGLVLMRVWILWAEKEVKSLRRDADRAEFFLSERTRE